MDNRNLLFYDTETTGFPLFSERSSDPRQPHVVQLGFKIVDSFTRLALDAANVIIKPEGWTIPDAAAAVHGITTERALDEGIPERKALGMLIDAWASSDCRVGHNEQFDARIVRIGLFRYDEPKVADHWKDGLAECTQRTATPIINAERTGKKKTANLAEAYEFFTGRKLDGAHDAMVDVNGCEAVYWAIKDRQQAAA